MTICFLFAETNSTIAQSTFLWAKKTSNGQNNEVTSICTDPSGNIFQTGEYIQAITFGTFALNDIGFGSMFLVKYDANGNVLWARSAGGNNIVIGNSVATDIDGNVFVTGYFQTARLIFGTDTINNISPGTPKIFLVKYNPFGTELWAKSAGGTATDKSISVTVDYSGNPYITGYSLSPTMTFGTITLTNPGPSSVFIAKYAGTSGIVLWAKNAGGTQSANGASVAYDHAGHVYLTGYYNCPNITFGTFTLSCLNTPTFDMFLVKYDSLGVVLWAKNYAGINNVVPNCVAVDHIGN